MVVRIQTYSVPMLCPGISNVLGYVTLIHTGTTGTDRFLVAQLTSEQINLGWQALQHTTVEFSACAYRSSANVLNEKNV